MIAWVSCVGKREGPGRLKRDTLVPSILFLRSELRTSKRTHDQGENRQKQSVPEMGRLIDEEKRIAKVTGREYKY